MSARLQTNLRKTLDVTMSTSALYYYVNKIKEFDNDYSYKKRNE